MQLSSTNYDPNHDDEDIYDTALDQAPIPIARRPSNIRQNNRQVQSYYKNYLTKILCSNIPYIIFVGWEYEYQTKRRAIRCFKKETTLVLTQVRKFTRCVENFDI